MSGPSEWPIVLKTSKQNTFQRKAEHASSPDWSRVPCTAESGSDAAAMQVDHATSYKILMGSHPEKKRCLGAGWQFLSYEGQIFVIKIRKNFRVL